MKAERKEWTLQEWLDNFQIEKYEQESITWNELLMGIAKVTAMMPIDKITPHIIKSMFMALYLHYDPNGDFVSQVKENHTLLDKIFRKTYGKSIIERVEGYVVCPTGDYSGIEHFPDIGSYVFDPVCQNSGLVAFLAKKINLILLLFLVITVHFLMIVSLRD